MAISFQRAPDPELIRNVQEIVRGQPLHGYVGLALDIPDLVIRADVRMIQGGSCPRLAEDPQASLHIREGIPWSAT
jgi:hypothetical protein